MRTKKPNFSNRLNALLKPKAYVDLDVGESVEFYDRSHIICMKRGDAAMEFRLVLAPGGEVDFKIYRESGSLLLLSHTNGVVSTKAYTSPGKRDEVASKQIFKVFVMWLDRVEAWKREVANTAD